MAKCENIDQLQHVLKEINAQQAINDNFNEVQIFFQIKIMPVSKDEEDDDELEYMMEIIDISSRILGQNL